jgi:hypothetical protein
MESKWKMPVWMYGYRQHISTGNYNIEELMNYNPYCEQHNMGIAISEPSGRFDGIDDAKYKASLMVKSQVALLERLLKTTS